MTDVTGRPLSEAKAILDSACIKYVTEYSRPQSRFFPIDEGNSYVLRQRKQADGRLMLTIADKLRKEVS